MFNKTLDKSDDSQSIAVEDVLKIARDLTRENKVIKIDLLYKLARRSLKIESMGLYQIIHHLLGEKIIVEGTKVVKDDVLLHQYRSQIYEFIKAYPGVHFSIIKKKISPDGSTGRFIWHLGILLRYKFIKRLEVKRYSLILTHDMDEQLGIYYFLLRDSINRKIIDYLGKNEPVRQMEIYHNTNETKAKVLYRIKSMVEYDMVKTKKEEQSRSTVVSITPEKKELLLKISSDFKPINF